GGVADAGRVVLGGGGAGVVLQVLRVARHGLARDRRRALRDLERGAGEDRVGAAIGLVLGRIVRLADVIEGVALRRGRRAALLRDVDQLVRHQVIAGGRAGLVAAGAEMDVVADRVRVRREIARGAGGVAAGVDADVAEVHAQRRLGARPHAVVERRAG